MNVTEDLEPLLCDRLFIYFRVNCLHNVLEEVTATKCCHVFIWHL